MTTESDASNLDAPAPADAPAPVVTVERELGALFGNRVTLITHTMGARVEQGIRTTFANGESFQHCVYDAHLDRIAHLDGIARPESDIARLSRVPDNEGNFSRNLREARLLLALRIDRKAPDYMIRTARLALDNITQTIQKAAAVKQAPPATGLISNMSPAVRAAAGLSMLAYLGVFLLKAHLHPIPHVPPPPRIPIPGPGIGIQQDIFIPADDTKAKLPTTRTRYSAPYTVTGPRGTTTHGARYTVTTTTR